MKVFDSLNRKQKDDVTDLTGMLEAYLTLWSYKYTHTQITHLTEMLSVIIKNSEKINK